MDREVAHERIRRFAVMAVHRVRRGIPNNFVNMLADDPAFPLDHDEIRAVISEIDHGQAEKQVDAVSRVIDKIISGHREAATYNPHPIR